MTITVKRLSVTAVKGTRAREVPEVRLGPDGAEDDRRFYVIDERDRMVNGKQIGELQTMVADYDGQRDRLSLTLPDRRVVEDRVVTGREVQTRFFSRPRSALLVEGPFSAAVSEACGKPLRLVQADGNGVAVDRGRAGGATLIAAASLARIASEAGVSGIDARRFRMLFEVDGIDAHAEDAWVGHGAQLGEARIEWRGHVGRCLITSREPESGRINLPTLDVLRDYRGDLPTTEPLPFGIYGAVVQPGVVRVGDAVSLLSR